MEKIEIIKWQEGINLLGFTRQQIFESIQEIDRSVFDDNGLATKQSDIERYEAYKNSYIFALFEEKIVGYLCYFPITELFYEAVIKGNNVYDGDIANTDICNLKDNNNYIFLLSVAIIPELQKRGISKLFSEIFSEEFSTVKIKEIVSYAFTKSGEHFLNHIGLKCYKNMEDGIKLMRGSLFNKYDNFDLVLAIPCDSTKYNNKNRDKLIISSIDTFDESYNSNFIKYDEKDLEIKNAIHDNIHSLNKNAKIFCDQIEKHRKYELIFNDESSKITPERNPLFFGQVVIYKDTIEDTLIPDCCYNFFSVRSTLSVNKLSGKRYSSFDNHTFNIFYFVVPDITYHDLTLLMDQSHELSCYIAGNNKSQINFMDYLYTNFGYKYFGKIYHIIFSDLNQYKVINNDRLKLYNILACEEYKSKEEYNHQIELSENLTEKFFDEYNMYSSYKAFASIYSYYYVINEDDKDLFYKRISSDINNSNFSSEGNILFVLETEIFKITACLVSSMDIYKQINNPDMVEIRNMFKHFINTRPLFEKLNYRYLGAQREADFIYKQFRISDMLSDYDHKRELLKSYCEVTTSINLNKNSKILNCIGLIFALIAGWDTLSLISKVIFDHEKSIIWNNELIIPILFFLLVVAILIINFIPVKQIKRFFTH